MIRFIRATHQGQILNLNPKSLTEKYSPKCHTKLPFKGWTSDGTVHVKK